MDHQDLIIPPMLGLIFAPLLFIAAGLGLAMLAGALMPKPKKPTFTFDNQLTQLAQRGSFIPYALGRCRIGASVFAWAGNRQVTFEASPDTSGGGGKGSMGKGGSTQPQGENIYYESAWHILCVGPGYALLKIWQGGKVIYEGDGINKDTTPSGTTLSAGHEGSFRIYWGEAGQPADALLTANVADPANFHGVVSLIWDQKRLGSSATWPQMDYEVAVKVQDAYVLSGSDNYFSGTDDDGRPYEGINAAHALNQILTAPFPWGVGIPSANVSTDALETMGWKLQGEHLCSNIVIRNGDDAQKTVADLIQDIGAVMPDVGGVITPALIRPVDPFDITAIPQDYLTAPLPETDCLAGDLPADSLVFTYLDEHLNYKQSDITITDDGLADLRGMGKVQTVDMPTVTNRPVGAIVSNRRQAELLGGVQSIQFKMTRTARALKPGQPVSVPNFNALRVMSTTRADDSPDVTVEAIKDVYSLAPIAYIPPDPVIPTPSPAVAADTIMEWAEIPFTNGPSLAVLRERSNTSAVGAAVHFSTNGSSYVNVGMQISPANTGVLIDDLPADADRVMDIGPTFTLESLDARRFEDLTGADARWRTGEQLAWIAGEIIYVQKVEAMGGDTYRLRGLIRCRARTLLLPHVAADRIWIVRNTDIAMQTSPLVVPGTSLYVKTQPYDGFGRLVDLSLCTAVSHDITGQYGPLFVGMVGNLSSLGLRAGYDADFDRRNVWRSGEDVRFTWTAAGKNGFGGAAGEQPAGTVCIPPTLPEGVFTVWIYKVVLGTPTLVRTVGTPDLFYDYTNATMVADCGGEPDELLIELVQSTGGATSSFPVTVSMERI